MIEQISNSCNVMNTSVVIEEILDLIINIDTGIRYTHRNPNGLSVLNKTLFGERYQSESIKVGDFPANTRTYSKNTILFRVRAIDPSQEDFVIGDFWEPPAEKVNSGRLNKKHERMLYLSIEDPKTAIIEARIKLGDHFMLMIYRSIEDIEVTEIGWEMTNPIVKLMNKIFSQHGDSIYKISEEMAKRIYQFENDGWCYPSVLHHSGTNFCMDLTCKHKVQLEAAFMYKHQNTDSELLSIFDLRDTNNIKKVSDWGRDNSLAKKLKREFHEKYPLYISLNQEAHKKQPQPEQKTKVVFV